MLPLTLPVAVGVNITLNGAFWPTARVSGKVSPLIEYVAGVTVTWEIVVLPVPATVRLPVWTPVFPTTTLPKFMVDGAPPKAGRTQDWPNAAFSTLETYM